MQDQNGDLLLKWKVDYASDGQSSAEELDEDLMARVEAALFSGSEDEDPSNDPTLVSGLERLGAASKSGQL